METYSGKQQEHYKTALSKVFMKRMARRNIYLKDRLGLSKTTFN